MLLSSVAVARSDWEDAFHRGAALETQGRYQDAASAFRSALGEAERMPPADARLPLTLHNLGAVERELGQYLEAERDDLRAISLWEKHQPERQAELASSLYNLAALYLVTGRLSRAEPLYRRAYELRQSVLGPHHPLTAASLHGLAHVLQERHRYAEAEVLYRGAISILEEAPGGSTTALADVLHNQAMLFRDRRRDEEALPLLERAARIYEQSAPSHPKRAVILRNLAELEADRGDMAGAGNLFQRSIAICEASLPAGHPQTGIILAAYGKFLARMRRKEEAREVTARARTILGAAARESASGYVVDVAALLP
jgi:tetratricopeptide (TPR) repeat protein